MPLADIKRIKASTAAKVNGIAAIKSNIEISFNPPPAIDKLVRPFRVLCKLKKLI